MENNLLSEKLSWNGLGADHAKIDAVRYSRDTLEMLPVEAPEMLPEPDGNSVLWVRVRGFKDAAVTESLCNRFGISFLTAQDILNVHHSSKVEMHDEYLFIVASVFRNHWNSHDECPAVRKERIRLVVSGNYVISFSDREESSFFDGVVEALRGNVLKIRQRSSYYLASVMLNEIVYDYSSEAVSVADLLEDMEDSLISMNPGRDIGSRIQCLRKRYLALKHAAAPLKEQFPVLLRPQMGLVSKADRPFYADVHDHLLNAMQEIDECRETMSSLMDLYISNNGLKMNDIMKKLTLLSTIFIPMTFLAGVWGMNFKFMPVTEWKYGYLFAWVSFAVSGVACYFIFRSKRWR